jgi:AcrR family transcriptional regulator
MLEVAARVFGRRGFHAASMDEIARACGLTKPMLYAYFHSKEGLYLATVDRAGRYLVAQIEELLDEADPLARLRRGAEILLRFIDRDRHGWAVLFAEGLGDAPVARHVAMYRAQIVRTAAITLAGGNDSRAVRAAEPYAVGMLGSGEALARWWLGQPGLDLEKVTRLARALVEAIYEAHRRRPGLESGVRARPRPSRKKTL